MKKLLIPILLLCSMPTFGADCFVSEYDVLAQDNNSNELPVAPEPAVATQNVTYTTSTASSAFASGVRFIRVICDAKAHFVIGTTPTAAATDPYLATDTAEFFGVIPGDKIAFYDGTS